MNKKIAFIGTHGTGKTTLAHELVLKLKKLGINADFSEEVSRRCPLPINEKAKTETQRWIIAKQITEETEKRNGCDVLVCDRSVLDTYSYQLALIGRKKSWEPFIKEYLKTYDLLIKVPITAGHLKDDGTRSLNRQFQEDVDQAINKNLKILKPKVIEYKGDETMAQLCKKLQVASILGKRA